MENVMADIRFYAACLASYNNGVLHGRWIDASADIDEMHRHIEETLRSSNFPNIMVKDPATGEDVPSAEEWAIHDMEGLPTRFGEHIGLEAIAAYVALVEEYSMEPADMAAIVDEFGTIEEAESALQDRFHGTYTSFRAYADDLADELLAPLDEQHIGKRYFDYESFARDLAHDYTVIELESGVAVFSA
jgi:antirestriction protein